MPGKFRETHFFKKKMAVFNSYYTNRQKNLCVYVSVYMFVCMCT